MPTGGGYAFRTGGPGSDVELGANFRGADLSEANLEGVDFTDAQLDGANLEDAHIGGAVGLDLGEKRTFIGAPAGFTLRGRIGGKPRLIARKD